MMERWEQTLDTLKTEISPHTFNTWLKPLQCKTFEHDKYFIEVPNTYYKEKIQKEFSNIILNRLREVSSNQNVQLSFVLSEEGASENKKVPTIVEPKQAEAKKDGYLNSKYTFDSFVVGNGNQFAHAACESVSKTPGQVYNPLFLYGGVGLGKTHLLSAIGNEINQSKPKLRVVYRSSEQFMNDLINSLKFGKMEEFRSRYRLMCDVLLLDDIQFFSGKERTQEEFFHTFNALHQDGKQIVLSSDRMPAEIPELDERLRSRFQAGLFCDIQKPDIETRVAILRKKADQHQVNIPNDVLFIIAEEVDSNIRVLEGCLNKMFAISSLTKRPIDLELAKEVVYSITAGEKKISTDDILKAVSSFFHLKTSDLKSARKHKVVAQPRQIAMYLARKLTSHSFPELGDRFGGKDHTTIMHGFSKIQKELETNAQLRSTIVAIEKNLQS